MAQITTGVRALLSHPYVYDLFQTIMGARKGRTEFATRFVQAHAGDRIVDIGCGTGDLLAYLPDVDYTGYDISEHYIEAARERFGSRGAFHCRLLTSDELSTMEPFDIALAVGLLHHLDDDEARGFIQMTKRALKPGGRLITIDPCFADGQNPIARWLVRADRGQNVRDRDGYISLVADTFSQVHATVAHRSWIPYTHCILVCTSD
ncbi:class I SAM-dependent methyltransferase [Trinickia sp.]|uniref:class I SAM-dependent methyltransferase n=1 Tax=Trinickia sp. TaxID=2571163 RepID=UPI003F7EDE79